MQIHFCALHWHTNVLNRLVLILVGIHRFFRGNLLWKSENQIFRPNATKILRTGCFASSISWAAIDLEWSHGKVAFYVLGVATIFRILATGEEELWHAGSSQRRFKELNNRGIERGEGWWLSFSFLVCNLPLSSRAFGSTPPSHRVEWSSHPPSFPYRQDLNRPLVLLSILCNGWILGWAGGRREKMERKPLKCECEVWILRS